MTHSSLDNGSVILADQVVELRWRHGQVHVIRRPSLPDAVDRAFVEENKDYLGDE